MDYFSNQIFYQLLHQFIDYTISHSMMVAYPVFFLFILHYFPSFCPSIHPSQAVHTAIHLFIFNIILFPALLTGTRSAQMAAVENDVTISLATLWADMCVCVLRETGGVLRRKLRECKRGRVEKERIDKAGLFTSTLAPIHNLSCSPSLLLR